MFKWIANLILGTPEQRRKANTIRKMFDEAEKEGYTYKVDRAGIHRVKIEEKKMFEWPDEFLSRPHEKVADEVEGMAKEMQSPPFRNPTHPCKKKPRIGKDAQNLVLWLEKNGFSYSQLEDWSERVSFWGVGGSAFCVERLSERAARYYSPLSVHAHQTRLVYTDDETSWIFYNAKRIQDERDKQRDKELKEQFK